MFSTQFLIEPVFLTPLAFGIVVVNILLLVIFIVVSSSFFKRIVLSTKEVEKIREEAHHEAEAFIARSREEALALITRTNTGVAQTLEDIHGASMDTQRKVEKTYESFVVQETERLRKGAQELLRSYEDAGVAARSSYQKSADAIDVAVMRQTQDAIGKFQKVLEEEAKHFRVSAEEHFHTWQKQAVQEIDVYKQASLKKIESSIYQIITLISKEVMGRALNLEGQQELVMRALEEAKKEGFFKS